MTDRSRAPGSTFILAGLAVIAGAVFNRAFRPWEGSAPLLILGVSGAVQVLALTVLVLRNWHPSGAIAAVGRLRQRPTLIPLLRWASPTVASISSRTSGRASLPA